MPLFLLILNTLLIYLLPQIELHMFDKHGIRLHSQMEHLQFYLILHLKF